MVSISEEQRVARLYVLYGRRIRAYIAARLGADYRLAEDLSQDAWLMACKQIGQLRAEDERAFGWLACIARGAIAAHYRRARSREVPADFGGPLGRLLPQAPAADDIALARMALRVLMTGPEARVGVAA